MMVRLKLEIDLNNTISKLNKKKLKDKLANLLKISPQNEGGITENFSQRNTNKIISKNIKNNKSVFIIAEAGVNHNGSIELAKKLIDVAVDAGVDAVKFQTFKASNLVSKDAKKGLN